MTPFYLLVADDHSDLCQFLGYVTKLVYQDSVQLVCVDTVPELLDYLATGKTLPNLLLLDYHLKPFPSVAPDILTWIKQQEHLQKLTVNVWSSLPPGPEAEACLQLGAKRFIPKLEALNDMVQFVKNLVEGEIYKI